MAFLRAYSAGSQGPGRGTMRGDPFIGGLVRMGLPIARKLAGKALGKLTGGRLIGAGGAKAAAKKILIGAGSAGGGIAAIRQLKDIPGPFQNPFGGRGGASGRRYRRMNAGNAKALRRAFRRIDAFTKLAQKAGYVRRKPFGARKRKVR